MGDEVVIERNKASKPNYLVDSAWSLRRQNTTTMELPEL
jgi:hypothetical protein